MYFQRLRDVTSKYILNSLPCLCIKCIVLSTYRAGYKDKYRMDSLNTVRIGKKGGEDSKQWKQGNKTKQGKKGKRLPKILFNREESTKRL